MTTTLRHLRAKMLALRDQEASPKDRKVTVPKSGSRSLKLPSFPVPVLGTVGEEGTIKWKKQP